HRREPALLTVRLRQGRERRGWVHHGATPFVLVWRSRTGLATEPRRTARPATRSAPPRPARCGADRPPRTRIRPRTRNSGGEAAPIAAASGHLTIGSARWSPGAAWCQRPDRGASWRAR